MAAAPARSLPGFLGAHENLNTRAQGARGSTREGRGRARDLASNPAVLRFLKTVRYRPTTRKNCTFCEVVAIAARFCRRARPSAYLLAR